MKPVYSRSTALICQLISPLKEVCLMIPNIQSHLASGSEPIRISSQGEWTCEVQGRGYEFKRIQCGPLYRIPQINTQRRCQRTKDHRSLRLVSVRYVDGGETMESREISLNWIHPPYARKLVVILGQYLTNNGDRNDPSATVTS
jgi:hypothetical protein